MVYLPIKNFILCLEFLKSVIFSFVPLVLFFEQLDLFFELLVLVR